MEFAIRSPLHRLVVGAAAGSQLGSIGEQRTENPRVGGSIPPLATISFSYLMAVRVGALAQGRPNGNA